MIFLDGLAHNQSGLRCGGRLLLAGGSLDEIGTRIHGKDGCFFDVRSRLQSSGFEDYLHVVLFTGCFEFLYLLAHAFIVSSQELAHRNNDVYFIGAFHQCHGSFCHFHFNESLGGGETC